MSGLVLQWTDKTAVKRFDRAMAMLGDQRFRIVANRAVNRAGDMARTKVFRALARQTGLRLRSKDTKSRTISKAVTTKRSAVATLTYRMSSTGSAISLMHFGARETRRGVSAAPFGQRRIFPGTFIKGGKFPDRVDIGKGGQVFQREGSGRMPIGKVLSDVVIPAEMVKGESAAAFNSTGARALERRMAHELSRATGGVIG